MGMPIEEPLMLILILTLLDCYLNKQTTICAIYILSYHKTRKKHLISTKIKIVNPVKLIKMFSKSDVEYRFLPGVFKSLLYKTFF